jgi:hypothetical protein
MIGTVVPNGPVYSITDVQYRIWRGVGVEDIVNDWLMAKKDKKSATFIWRDTIFKTRTDLEDLMHGCREIQGERCSSNQLCWDIQGTLVAEGLDRVM